MTILELDNIYVDIAGVEILRGISLHVDEGEVVALVGRNGAGKTTTLRSIIGLQKVRSGKISLNGIDITNMPPYKVSKYGIGYAPEDRKIFADLTSYENIKVAMKDSSRERDILKMILDIFPELKPLLSRKGGYLSGGEQKMLCIARALALEPRLLLLDEPLEGLAPVVVKRFYSSIKKIKEYGFTMLIAESNIHHVPKLADRCYVIERGEIIFEGSPHDILTNNEIAKIIKGY